ncbi:MAG: hypothetical protein M3071_19025 [Actinomycetota bacterium]|nr:hypothetical protein [Actinomycetota bacterium]
MRVARLTAAWLAFLLAVAVVPGAAATSSVPARHASATIWLDCGAGGFEKLLPVDDPYAFPASALRGPAGVENGSDPAAVALREFIARGLPLPTPLPAHTYVLLRETATTALYGHVAGPGVIDASISFRELDGQWQYQQNGSCFPAPVFVAPPPPTSRSTSGQAPPPAPSR